MENITHDTIDALSAENRKFPPSEAFKANALVTGTFLYDEAAEDDEAFWARQAADLLDWATPWHTILDWQLPDAKWFVGGQLNVAYNCLDRHVLGRQGRQGRHPLGRRARRHPDHHLPAAARRGLPVRQRPQGSRRRARRPREHLPPDGPRGRRRDARLCPHRRRPQRGVRWVLGPVALRSHQRRRGQGAHHRRRRLPPRRRVPAQARRRRGVRRRPDDRARRGRQARRQRRRHGRRA